MADILVKDGRVHALSKISGKLEELVDPPGLAKAQARLKFLIGDSGLDRPGGDVGARAGISGDVADISGLGLFPAGPTGDFSTKTSDIKAFLTQSKETSGTL